MIPWVANFTKSILIFKSTFIFIIIIIIIITTAVQVEDCGSMQFLFVLRRLGNLCNMTRQGAFSQSTVTSPVSFQPESTLELILQDKSLLSGVKKNNVYSILFGSKICKEVQLRVLTFTFEQTVLQWCSLQWFLVARDEVQKCKMQQLSRSRRAFFWCSRLVCTLWWAPCWCSCPSCYRSTRSTAV